MDIIFLLLAFAIGYIIGWKLQGRKLLRNLFSDPDHMIRLLETYKQAEVANIEAKIGVTEITVEQDNNTYFLYAKTTNEILGQGASLDAALNDLRVRFPNKVFAGELSKTQADTLGLSK